MFVLWAAIAVIAYFGLSKILRKWFEHVYSEYGINAISIKHQITGLMFFGPLWIALFNEEIGLHPVILLGIPTMVFVVMCGMNAKLRNPLTIVTTSICQIFYAATFVVRLFIWLCLCVASFAQSVFYGKGFTVTYNPIFHNNFKNNRLVQTKKPFSYTPEESVGVMNHLGVYTYDINRSRIMAERHRLENELQDVQNSKYEAMAYGFDIAEFEMREHAIKDEIASLS